MPLFFIIIIFFLVFPFLLSLVLLLFLFFLLLLPVVFFFFFSPLTFFIVLPLVPAIFFFNNNETDGDGVVGRAGLDDPSREAIPVSEETSRRLAVTNCDWDHMRARDLMVLCSSFCPGGASRLVSVTVHPSDFGMEMMEVEAAAGPHAALSVAAAAAAGKGEKG